MYAVDLETGIICYGPLFITQRFLSKTQPFRFFECLTGSFKKSSFGASQSEAHTYLFWSFHRNKVSVQGLNRIPQNIGSHSILRRSIGPSSLVALWDFRQSPLPALPIDAGKEDGVASRRGLKLEAESRLSECLGWLVAALILLGTT